MRGHAEPLLKRLVGVMTACAAALTALLPMPLPATAADGSCGTSAVWTLENNVLTISGTGAVSTSPWSGYSDRITTIVVEEGITSLPSYAFNNFSALTSLKLPESVTSLGSYMCYSCRNLTTVTFPTKLTEIPMFAFFNCNSMASLKLPEGLKSIGESAFYANLALSALTLPAGVTDVGASAFYGNNIKEISLGNSLQTIGQKAFGMSCFDTVTIPESVKSIGTGAFEKYYVYVVLQGSKLYGTSMGSSSVTTIRGKSGSVAETFAESAGLRFEATDGTTHTHTWSDWITDPAAGCETAGTRKRTCTGCGTSESETISPTGHSWSSWETVTQAQCGQYGEECRTCANCGQIETRMVATTGHSWSNWETVTQAQCEQPGEECRTCANCGQTETRTVAATGHSWGDWTTVRAATLTEEGLRERICRNGCGATQRETIPTLTGYTISVTAGEGGTVTPSGVTAVEAGSSLTITVNPNAGWYTASLLIDGAAASLTANGTYTFTNIQANHTVSVVFRQETVQPERVCGVVSVVPSRKAWYSDEAAFDSRDFVILAAVTENGSTTWASISASCVPMLTPAAAAENRYGNTSVPFRYTGSDSAVAAYFQQNTVQAEIPVYLRGDGNGNREVEVTDAMLALQAYVESVAGNRGVLTDVQQVILDVDETDGVVLEDAMYILRYYTMVIGELNPQWRDIISK